MNDINDLYSQSNPQIDEMDLYFNSAPTKGFTGIAQDIGSSLETLPGAIGELLKSLPTEAYSSGKQVITNPLRAGSNLAGGVYKGLRGAANIPHNIREYLLEKEIPLSTENPFPMYEPTAIEQYLLSGEPQKGDALLRGIGEYVPFSPIGRGMQGIKGIGARASGAGLMGAGNEEMNPIHTAMAGLLADIGLKGAEKGIEKVRGGKPKILKGIEPEDVAETVEAANRLGLTYVTPGEASGFSYVGKQEGKIGNTLEGSKLREKRARERSESEEVAINNFLNKLDDKIELPKEKKAIYENVMQNIMPENIANDFLLDDSINLAAKKIEKNAAYRQELKGVPKNSFKYWDLVKKSMDDAQQSALRKGENYEATLIGKSREKLVSKMDEIDPNYARARKLAQRSILRNDIEKGFNKKPKNGKNFYETIIKDKDKFAKLYRDLSEFPDMQQDMRDMKLVFPKLYGESNAKGAVKGERLGYETPRNPFEYMNRLIKQLMNEKGDIKSVEAITTPDWFNQMQGNSISAPPSSIYSGLEKSIQDLLKASQAAEQYNE